MAIEANAVRVGTMAPDFNLETTAGRVNLSEYRGQQNVLLYIMRELGCMMCRRHLAQLKQISSQLQQRGTTVLVVGKGSQQEAQRLSSQLQLPFPVAADPNEEIYHRYGLEKVMLFVQRSGTVLIDKQGKVGYIHRVTNPGASFDKDEILKEVDLLR